MAEKLGKPLMPWQRQVVDVIGEMVRDEETGVWVPAYAEALITVPRQQGKTVVMLAFKVDRLTLWEAYDQKPQLVTYSAQSGSAARLKFREDFVTILRESPFYPLIERTYLAADNHGFKMRDDGRLLVLSNSEDAGHGLTLDFSVLDEIFADSDDRREQAVLPAMATRHDHQRLLTSTAGTDSSVFLERKQAAGRAAVEEGRTEGIAYFEWSAEEEDDPEDPAVWRKVMPALGYEITERTVRTAYDSMRNNDDVSEFKRAWLNIPKLAGATRPIPLNVWHAATGDFTPDPTGPKVFGVDAAPFEKAASIVGAVGDTAALVHHAPGMGWLEQTVIDLALRHDAEVAIDEKGPASTIIAGLEAAGVRVHKFNVTDYARACAWFKTAVIDRTVRIRADHLFTSAVEAARTRTVSDAWLWARKDLDSDVSPLVACTLALHRAHRPDKPNPGFVMHVIE